MTKYSKKLVNHFDDFLSYINDQKTRTVNFLGYKIINQNKVFPIDSPFSITTKIIAENLSPRKNVSALDIGTGTGVLAIILAKKGYKKVIAVDINKNSLKNAKLNAEAHKLGKIIKVRKSNLFNSIKPAEKFDIIVANLPLTDMQNKSRLKSFLFDYQYKIHERFLKTAKKHLNKNGIIMIPNGEVGNEKKLNILINKYNYKINKIKTEKHNNINFKLYILESKD